MARFAARPAPASLTTRSPAFDNAASEREFRDITGSLCYPVFRRRHAVRGDAAQGRLEVQTDGPELHGHYRPCLRPGRQMLGGLSEPQHRANVIRSPGRDSRPGSVAHPRAERREDLRGIILDPASPRVCPPPLSGRLASVLRVHVPRDGPRPNRGVSLIGGLVSVEGRLGRWALHDENLHGGPMRSRASPGVRAATLEMNARLWVCDMGSFRCNRFRRGS